MNKSKIICITGNTGKTRIFQNTIGDLLDLEVVDIDAPEVQSMNVEDVAAFSALWAAKHLSCPVLKMDVSYEIKALNGFPGPFVKWINKTLTPENILRMMDGVDDRTVMISHALAYARPDGFSETIRIDRQAWLAQNASAETPPWSSVFDRISYADMSKSFRFAEKSFDFQIEYLSDHCRHDYRQLAMRIANR